MSGDIRGNSIVWAKSHERFSANFYTFLFLGDSFMGTLFAGFTLCENLWGYYLATLMETYFCRAGFVGDLFVTVSG